MNAGIGGDFEHSPGLTRHRLQETSRQVCLCRLELTSAGLPLGAGLDTPDIEPAHQHYSTNPQAELRKNTRPLPKVFCICLVI